MQFNFIRNIGFILLAVYLILQGLALLIPGFTIPSVLFGILALVTAGFILTGR